MARKTKKHTKKLACRCPRLIYQWLVATPSKKRNIYGITIQKKLKKNKNNDFIGKLEKNRKTQKELICLCRQEIETQNKNVCETDANEYYMYVLFAEIENLKLIV
jgi:hypothetical protein